MNFQFLSEHINEIGEQMAKCTRNCDGIRNEPSKGIIPRGLILEAGDQSDMGFIVMGINPGTFENSIDEKEILSKKGIRANYDTLKEVWEKATMRRPYYSKIRKFIRNIKIDGINSQCPILWTDIVKCESITESTIKNGKLVQKILPIQNETKCTCASLFLENELNNPLIKDWPIFAIGRDAFEALNGMLPEKTLMGIFHTSYGHLEKWVKEDKNNIESKMNELLVHSVKSHVWLPRNREEWGK